MELNNIIIFDRVRNLCNALVQFLIKRDADRIFNFLPIQSIKATDIAAKYIFQFEVLTLLF